jgi:REP element-mobilizing transposase RayT
MARQLRLEYAGALYHITSRGNAQAAIYLDDEDRTRFLDLLGQEVEQQGWQCYAYCLMDNHYHLLIETPEPNLSKGMRRLNQVYTQGFNRRHGRVGHVLQGRYKAIIVDKDSYLLELCRYIVLNPIRAGMVNNSKDWRWSSYRATAGLGTMVDWLQVGRVLDLFGSGRQLSQRRYREFVKQGLTQPSPWEALKGQVFLGSEQFLESMDRLLKGRHLDNVPRAQTLPARPDKVRVLDIIAHVYDVSHNDIVTRHHAESYQTAAWLLRRATNLSLKDTADVFGVSPSRISHIQHMIESRCLTERERKATEMCKIKQ